MSPKVRILVEQLRDKSFAVSKQAAESLAKMGDKARAAGSALAERVADDYHNGYATGTGSKNAAPTALQKIERKRVRSRKIGD